MKPRHVLSIGRRAVLLALAVSTLPWIAGAAPASDPPEPAVAGSGSPLPAELREEFESWVEESVRLRGLDAGPEVPAGVQTPAALLGRLEELFDEELPPKVLEGVELALKRFGLLPRDYDLRARYLELLSSQVAGYFDPASERILLVEGAEGGLGGDVAAGFGEGLAKRLEASVFVHEIVHYLQHRHFDLEELLGDDPLSDGTVARQALVEGDATLMMWSFLMDVAIERMPLIETLSAQILSDPEMVLAMAPDMPGTDQLAEVPVYLRDNLLFPYLQGFLFCVNVRKAGGQPLLDYAFREDPPASTEQILHPEKWLGERDPPVRIELPDLSPVLKGWRKAADGSWGELNTRIALAGPGGADERARRAAEGWGGDAFALYRRGKKDLAVWVTEWDSAEDAQEFHELAAEVYAGWRVVDAGPQRVVLFTTDGLSGKKLRAVEQALGEAVATRPEPSNLDLAALGISEADRARPFDFKEMMDLMSKPFFRELLEAGVSAESWGEYQELFQDPAVMAELEQMVEGMDAGDFETLLRDNPALGEMMEEMLSAETPEITSAGGVFRIAELGFRAAAPTAPGWQTMASESEDGPFTVLAAYSTEDSGFLILAVLIKLPVPGPLEMMIPGLEAGLGLGELVQERKERLAGPPDGVELEYTGLAEGNRVRLLVRLYTAGGYMLSLQALGPDALWEEVEQPVRGFFDGIEFEPSPESRP